MKKNLIIYLIAILCLPMCVACSSSSKEDPIPTSADFKGMKLNEVKQILAGDWGLIKRTEVQGGEWKEYDPYVGDLREIITFEQKKDRYRKMVNGAGINDWRNIVWKQKQLNFGLDSDIYYGTYNCFTPEGDDEFVPFKLEHNRLTIIKNALNGGESIYQRMEK